MSVSGAVVCWDREGGILSLHFTNGEGFGRIERKIKLASLESLRIIADVSSLEIYINGGRYVISTRFYPEHWDRLSADGATSSTRSASVQTHHFPGA